MAHTDIAGLLERAEQLRGMRASLSRVVNGSRGATILVAGEAGIGKTTLLRHFASDVDGSARVFWTACDPLFTPRPLGPLLELADVIGGDLADQIASGGQAFDVAATLLRELRLVAAPAVVMIEDVHWADEATLDVIRLLARRIESVPVLLVLSYRDDQLDRAHPLRVVLGELPGSGRLVTRLALGGLSTSAVATLVRGREMDPDELHERTGGNPFFVTEVLAADAGQVPHSVRDAVLARAARISPPARQLLDAAAVVPGQIETWMLEALHPAAMRTLDECLGSGMLTAQDGRVAFRHEIARLVIEDSLPVGQRTMLHAKVLSVLQGNEDAVPDWARMAHHAEAAGDHNAVLRYAPAAAKAASAAGAHREALDLYRRALQYASRLPPEEQADLLEGFAGESYIASLSSEGIDKLNEARKIHQSRGDLLAEGRTLWKLARHLGRHGKHTRGLATALQAVEVLEQLPPHAELALAYVHVAGYYGVIQHPDAISWGYKAIALGEEVGCAEAVYEALNIIGSAEILGGDLAGVANLERSRELAEQAGDSQAVARAHLHLCWMLMLRKEWELAGHYLGPSIAYCRDHGLELWLDQLEAFQMEADLVRGNWNEAARAAEAVLARQDPSPAGVRCSALSVLARIRARRGEPNYQPLLDEARELTKLPHGAHLTAPVAAARAEAAWLEGHLADVLAEVALAQGPALGLDPLATTELRCWQWRAGADVSEGVAVLPEPYRTLLTGDRHGASRLWQQKGSPYEAALALTGSADVDALRGAIDVLKGLGARPVVAILVRELRSLGERRVPREPRPATSAHPAGLTGREVEVLRLLADGMRNAEIAAHLVVSPRTVDHHVSAVLRKLNVRTRSEAITAAMRLGLVQA